MNSVSDDSIDQLMQNVEVVDQILQMAEQQLRDIGHYDQSERIEDESSAEFGTINDVFDRFDAINLQVDTYRNRFAAWDESELTVYQKSEVTRSLGQIKCLTLVTQSVRRICRKALGIPDPECEQQELQMQLSMMGQQFK